MEVIDCRYTGSPNFCGGGGPCCKLPSLPAVMMGSIRNNTGRRLTYVKIRAIIRNKRGHPLARAEGFNDAYRLLQGKIVPGQRTSAIPPGGTDTFTIPFPGVVLCPGVFPVVSCSVEIIEWRGARQ